MTAFRRFPAVRQHPCGNTDGGFDHVSSPVQRIVGRVAIAAIEGAELEGDIARAERMRAMLREFQGGCDAS